MDLSKFRVKQKGDKVFLAFNDRLFVEIGWREALQMSQALRSVAKLAEEHEKAEQIIKDGAILDRAGFPIGLSNNPKIKDEVRKEAQYNRDLRRYMPPPSIPSKEVFGTPTLVQEKS